jgi:sugar/nucleoside kinase (ribokinase family)
MDKPFDLLVAGEINPDLILSGDVEPAFGQVEKLVDSATLVIGSSSAIFACGAARLGLKVAFVGVCGDDLFGRFILDEMVKRGVDVSNVITDPTQQTGLSVILNRGADRAILTHAGCIAALRADQVTDSLLQKARHLHCPPACPARPLPPRPRPQPDHLPRHQLGPVRQVARIR